MFRFYSSPIRNQPRVSIVGRCSEGILRIAVARCSKKDHFVKKKGRTIAEGRLAKGKTYTQIPMKDCDIQQFLGVAKQVADQVLIDKIVYNEKLISHKKI